jgi:hypothetical protein
MGRTTGRQRITDAVRHLRPPPVALLTLEGDGKSGPKALPVPKRDDRLKAKAAAVIAATSSTKWRSWSSTIRPLSAFGAVAYGRECPIAHGST